MWQIKKPWTLNTDQPLIDLAEEFVLQVHRLNEDL